LFNNGALFTPQLVKFWSGGTGVEQQSTCLNFFTVLPVAQLLRTRDFEMNAGQLQFIPSASRKIHSRLALWLRRCFLKSQIQIDHSQKDYFFGMLGGGVAGMQLCILLGFHVLD